MPADLTHWRKTFDYRFLSGEELLGKDWTLTIKEVRKEEVFSQQHQKNEERLAVWFTETPKGIIVNSTNAKTISRVLETPFIEQWVGKQITIRPTKVRAFGTDTVAIRVVDPIKDRAALKQYE